MTKRIVLSATFCLCLLGVIGCASQWTEDVPSLQVACPPDAGLDGGATNPDGIGTSPSVVAPSGGIIVQER